MPCAIPPTAAMMVAPSITFCPGSCRDKDMSVATMAAMMKNAIGQPVLNPDPGK